MINVKLKLGTMRVMQKKLGATRAMMQQIGADLATETIILIDEGFNQSRDPRGRKWRKVKRGGKPLILTGKMQGSFSAIWSRGGIKIMVGVPYFPYHQHGTSTIHRRSMTPFNGDLGKWRKRYGKVVDRVMEKHFG